jgi:hypothetical protein
MQKLKIMKNCANDRSKYTNQIEIVLRCRESIEEATLFLNDLKQLSFKEAKAWMVRLTEDRKAHRMFVKTVKPEIVLV